MHPSSSDFKGVRKREGKKGYKKNVKRREEMATTMSGKKRG